MKRSEMIKLIDKIVETCNCSLCMPEGISKAELILLKIEEAGMQPPLREKLVTLLPYEDGEWTSFAYEWEAE